MHAAAVILVAFALGYLVFTWHHERAEIRRADQTTVGVRRTA
jgi:hypothetical protein